MTTLTITAAEWARAKDGTLWIVREGGPNAIVLHQTPDMHGPSAIPPTPPAEFVQACAPCQTCDGTRMATEYPLTGWRQGEPPDDIPCPDCRIELVGPCPNAEGCPAGMAPLSCGRCYQIVQVGGTVTLGHAYAVGQPLPIVKGAADVWLRSTAAGSMRVQGGCVAYTQPNKSYSPGWVAWSDGEEYGTKIGHTALAHYGPPESLVGTWALQLAVTA